MISILFRESLSFFRIHCGFSKPRSLSILYPRTATIRRCAEILLLLPNMFWLPFLSYTCKGDVLNVKCITFSNR